jgi:hypothetical protein
VIVKFFLRRPGSPFFVTRPSLDGLDDDTRNRVLKLLKDELKDAGLIGRPETKSPLLTRVLHLVKDPEGRPFLPDLRVLIRRLT